MAVMSRYRRIERIDTLIIHCAATPNGVPYTVDDIDDWHGPGRVRRGLDPFRRDPNLIGYHMPHLKHIGYHFVIYTNGAVIPGRRLEETGAHARGYNQSSVGVCLIGTDSFTWDAWRALKDLKRSLCADLPNLKRTIGHSEVNDRKTCPGFDVQAWLAAGATGPLGGHVLLEGPQPSRVNAA